MKLLFAFCFLLSTFTASASEWIVSPSATTNGGGSGTLVSPGSLTNALTGQGWASAIAAGDTIWLRGGTYFPMMQLASLTGTNVVGGGFGWSITKSGSAGNLITLRSYSGEWAKIDRPWRGTGQYLRFRDLELYDSLKGFDPGAAFIPPPRPWSHFDGSGNNKHEFINCVLHDVNNVWAGGVVAKVRGCIIWHAGNQNLEHIAYSAFANQDTDEYSGNISYWPSGQVIELGNPGLTIASNIMAGAGATIGSDYKEILFVEAGVVNANCTYDIAVPSRAFESAANLGATNNVFVSVGPVKLTPSTTSSFYSNLVYQINAGAAYANVALNGNPSANLKMDYNSYYSANTVRFENATLSWNFTQWKTNGFDAHSTAADSTAPPDLVRVFPNADQPKRAHVAIYNFTGADNVSVNLSGVLSIGDWYQLYSAQNYGAGPIRLGVYNGPISVPMTNLTAATFLYTSPNHDWGLSAPSPTSPEFGAFVVVGSSGTTATVSGAFTATTAVFQ